MISFVSVLGSIGTYCTFTLFKHPIPLKKEYGRNIRFHYFLFQKTECYELPRLVSMSYGYLHLYFLCHGT